ncbi:TPA: hypothetical protein QDZ42_003467 [Stenotrophomonas maltophilia]|nr:hypothetical protein [Stenotrophomonas maltophilia]HDS1044787.1 hypothetical protein [Stenotrophomonas maltophilia]
MPHHLILAYRAMARKVGRDRALSFSGIGVRRKNPCVHQLPINSCLLSHQQNLIDPSRSSLLKSSTLMTVLPLLSLDFRHLERMQTFL